MLVFLLVAAALPPFDAWLDVNSAYVRESPDAVAPIVALLRRGDDVRVTACVPDCETAGSWAILGDDGAMRLSLLSLTAPPPPLDARSARARYLWGSVRTKGTVRRTADPAGKVLERLAKGRVLAFLRDDPRLAEGWLQRPDGGFVSIADIRLSEPSTLNGEVTPQLPLAFAYRDAVSTDAAAAPIVKYGRATVVSSDTKTVTIASGVFARKDLRIASRRTRPREVREGAKWVHVDLSQQVLVAYEGDMPVFATLVATGVDDDRRRTPEGIFPVWLKTVHHRMTGTQADPYEVDEVPFSLFFKAGFAIHGAFWHDRFGTRRSHGCVNMSMADAEWLFRWAPPRLPDGWHSAIPLPAKRETLMVFVERTGAAQGARRAQTPHE